MILSTHTGVNDEDEFVFDPSFLLFLRGAYMVRYGTDVTRDTVTKTLQKRILEFNAGQDNAAVDCTERIVSLQQYSTT
jgi:hypothetical protein